MSMNLAKMTRQQFEDHLTTKIRNFRQRTERESETMNRTLQEVSVQIDSLLHSLSWLNSQRERQFAEVLEIIALREKTNDTGESNGEGK